MVYVKSNELYHHGILGQRWGKRNGPPYPLGASDHSASEKKAGWKRSLAKDPEVAEKKQKMKQAKREFNRAYNYAYNRNLAAYSPIKAHRIANDKRWEIAANKQVEYFAAKKAYKDAKRLAKENLKKYGNRNINATSGSNVKSGGVRRVLGLTDEEAKTAKQIAKVAGISIGTAAGILALACVINKYANNDDGTPLSIEEIYEKIKTEADNDLGGELEGINSDKLHRNQPFNLDNKLFHNLFNDDYIGAAARKAGYKPISSDFIKDAINSKISPDNPERYYEKLVDKVRCRYASFGSGSRRLSCWSASNAYFMSAMTGKDFISKSFTNLVNFNDFGKLYKTSPEIFDAFGHRVNNYVGKFGRRSDTGRADAQTTKALIENIFKNVSDKNNLTADGTRTIGFVNAAYRGMTCTHEWNFEIFHGMDGVKELIMSDGYAGERFKVAKLLTDGTINYETEYGGLIGDGFNGFLAEMNHYNADSFRFYAPTIDSINTDMMSKVILGKS